MIASLMSMKKAGSSLAPVSRVRLASVAVVLSVALFWQAGAMAAENVCPSDPSGELNYVGVFDGDPSELASLLPDIEHKNSGYFTLWHIYDQGRYATVRCQYAGGIKRDIVLKNRVSGCGYKFDHDHVSSFVCR